MERGTYHIAHRVICYQLLNEVSKKISERNYLELRYLDLEMNNRLRPSAAYPTSDDDEVLYVLNKSLVIAYQHVNNLLQ